MRLSEFVEIFVIPVWHRERHASALTIGLYRESMRYWVAFTGDPPLDEIDDFSAAAFLAGLYELPGRQPGSQVAPPTVHKHCRSIQTALNLAGPRSASQRKAQALLDQVVYLEKPILARRRVEADEFFTFAEIGQILAAVSIANKLGRGKGCPRVPGVRPSDWWDTLVTLYVATVDRKTAVLNAQYDRLVPVADPAPKYVGCAHLTIDASARKGRIETNRVILPPWAVMAVEKIRTPLPRKLIVPWSHCARHLYTCWWKILGAAGIPEARWFGPHALRKRKLTDIYYRSGAQAAQDVGGHGAFSTTLESYIAEELKDEALLREPDPHLPRQPLDPQRLLFDL